MVGFKSVWPLIFSLLLFAACVPSSKQTECGSNEAFNSQLRSCVPIVQGPSAFINISSYSPLYTSTRYKSDTTPVTLTIAVSNPYNQSYTVEWDHNYNGTVNTIAGNVLTTSAFIPSLYSTNIGSNVVTAKIISGGAVVDSHNFEIVIQESPTPNINTGTLFPADYYPILYPDNTGQRFSFTERNNGATSISNYRVFWTLSKNGVNLPAYAETDTLTNTSTNGTNVMYYGTSTVPLFVPSTLGVGSYVLRSRIENISTGDVVAEHQWNISVQQPPLENISSTSVPAVGVTTTSYHALDYTQSNTYNFVYTGTTQSDFCVTIDDGDGTYDGDGLGVQVKWYLEGLGGDICTKETTDTNGPQTLCLVDANNCSGGVPFDTTLLKFTNTSSTVTQNHTVVARVYDRAINTEYTSTQVTAPPNAYPLSWTVVTKPVNSAPTVGFGTTNPSGCSSSGSYTKTGCAVTQGTNFTVSFTVTDDFYDPATVETEFGYTVELRRNGTAISGTGCTKAVGAAVPAYTTEWTCTMAVPHYDSSGVIDPSSGSYTVVAYVTDNGSPVGGTAAQSVNLTWNLTITEDNSSTLAINPQVNLNTDSHAAQGATVMDPAGTTSATELQTLTFIPNIDDTERDNVKVQLSLCKTGGAACTTSSVVVSYTTFLRSLFTDPTANPALLDGATFTGLNYLLPEDVMITANQDVATGVPTPIYFKLDVSDIPSVGTTTVKTDSEIFTVYLNNYNPAPAWGGTPSPALSVVATPSTYYDVVAGFPFSIDPGAATDASNVTAENTLYYKFYASDDNATWTEIPRASDSTDTLVWTPDSGVVGSIVYITACVGDRALANAAVTANAAQCRGPWIFNVKDSVKTLSATGLTDQGTTAAAVWHDTTDTSVYYTAYIGAADSRIYVEKTVMETDGDLDTASFATVSFTALTGGAATASIQDLSLTGTADDLYISYVASAAASPGTKRVYLRRIDKQVDTLSVGDKANMSDTGKFGFAYAGYTIADTSAAVTFTADALNGTARQITFATAPATGETITINGYAFTADGTPTLANEICDTTACASGVLAAENLAEKINDSTAQALQGITAFAAGGVVSLYGNLGGDYLDIDGSIAGISGISVVQAGKIWTSGGRLYIPIINASLGAQQNYISLLSLDEGEHLQSGAIGYADNEVLDSGKALAFSNGIDTNGDIIIAMISGDTLTSGAAYLKRFDGTSPFALDTNSALFTGKTFQSIVMSPPATGNAYHYVLAKEKTVDGGEWNIGRYDSNLATPLEYFLTDRLLDTDTSGVIDNDAFVNPQLVSVTGTAEARIFFISDTTASTGDWYPYVARLNSGMNVTCGYCDSITTNEVSSSGVIGVSQYVSDVTLGDVGATVGENQNDSIFAVFNVNNGANQVPYTGLIDVESEAIQSTSKDATDRFFRPGFVK